MSWLASRSRLASLICGLTVASAVAVVVIAIADPNSAGPTHTSPAGPTARDKPQGGYVPYAVLTAIVFSTFAVVGAVVAARRPRNPIGWMVAVGALMCSLAGLSKGVFRHMAFGGVDAPAASEFLAGVGTWAVVPSFV